MRRMTVNTFTIGALARRCGVSAHTLRFYETEGILNPVARDASGHRCYRPDDLLWLEFVLRLKRTGMPLNDIRTYAQLRAQGDATQAARLALLQAHRTRLAAQLNDLSSCADALDDKIRHYQHRLDADGVSARTSTP